MSIFLQTILTIWHRELIRYVRDRTRILTTFIQPLMFLAIFGVGLQSAFATQNSGFDFVQFMFPGIIAMNVMGVAFFSTVSTVWDREFGFLKEILVAPVPRSAIALGKTLGATSIASIQALILLALAPFLHLKIFFFQLPALLGVMLLLAFAISGLGLLISSRMRTTESFGLLMQVLVFPMFFLSGAFFPLTSVPSWMSVLAHINPLTYGVDGMRQILLRPTLDAAVLSRIELYTLSTDVLFLVGFSVGMVSLAVWAFDKKS
ncbi:ABC transporter permease [Candidatus Uhrbacteria bacterium]|nr:ABC transporter permease [Candidatus Uhrbacteria bacterium]